MAPRGLARAARLDHIAAGTPRGHALRGAAGREDHPAAASRRCPARCRPPPGNVLSATFDHPILKLAAVDAVLDAWRSRAPRAEGTEYLLLDEAQFIRDWSV
jgi:hypothetical protein